MSQNIAMTFPIKKKISAKLFIDRGPELHIYMQNGCQNFPAEWNRVKCWRQDQQEVGMKNQNGSLFRVNSISEEWETITSAFSK